MPARAQGGNAGSTCIDKIAAFYLNHACKVFWLGLVVLMALSIPAQEMTNFSAQSTHEYTVTESSPAREFDSADIAMKAVDSLTEAGNATAYRPRAFPSSQWGQFTAMYQWDAETAKKPDSTIFTPRSVQQICQMEQAMLDHAKYPDFCVLDYDDKFGRGKDACVPPTTVPTRLFYETTVLDCNDYMSRLFVTVNTSHPLNPLKWRLAELAKDANNCEEIAKQSNMPLVHYVDGYILATPTVLGMPAFVTAKGNPTGVPSGMGGAVAVAMANPLTWKMPERIPIFNYSSATPHTDCRLLPQAHVDRVNAYLMAMLAKKDLGGALGNLRGEDIFGFFMADDAVKKGYTRRTRTFYSLGAPLSPYIDEFDDSAAQRELYLAFARDVEESYFKRFGMTQQGLPAPRSAYRSKAVEDGVNFEFYGLLFQLGEFERTMNGDLPMTMLAVLFVWGYITFHTRSIFLANMAMCQILFSLPVSYTVYKYVWGIPFFSQLHILAIFLVLGVGADDVFVITDCYKETLFTVNPRDAAPTRKGGEVDLKDPATAKEYRRQRLRFAYSRTVVAVFNTSFTTAMAFVATGISPIMSIATFGWFAATCIVLNYVITVTWYPAVIVIKERYVDWWYGHKVCKSRKEDNPFGLPRTYPVLADKETCVVRCFKRCYVPMMTKPVGVLPARAIPLAIIVVLISYIAQATYFTAQLSPPNEEEQFFPADHMFTGLQNRLIDNYMGGAESSYASLSFVLGIKSEDIDRTGYNQYHPDVNRGKTVYDDSFDIFPKANQDAIVQLCGTLDAKVCTSIDDDSKKLAGCASSDKKLVRAGTMQCFMTEFQEWHRKEYAGVETWDTAKVSRANFTSRLARFRRETKPKNDDVTGSWKTQIGFIDGKLKFVRIAFGSSLKILDGVLTKQPVYAMVKKMAGDFNDAAPAGLKTAFPQGPLFAFGWMRTQQGFVDGLLSGLAICFPIAFAVLWMATGNILLAVYAVVCIAGVVTSVLGFCKVGMGWDLGVAESVAGIIVIGFSVDYIVHMSHMYVEAAEVAGAQTRIARFTYAAEKMGQTIIGGAITTAGSGCMMFACQMVFFFKMGVLVCATIIFSVVFSLGLFMSLCVLIGPEGHFGDTSYYVKRCMGWDHEGQGDTRNKRAETVDDDLSGIEIREWKASDSMRDSEVSLETVKVVTL